jgi:integrase
VSGTLSGAKADGGLDDGVGVERLHESPLSHSHVGVEHFGGVEGEGVRVEPVLGLRLALGLTGCGLLGLPAGRGGLGLSGFELGGLRVGRLDLLRGSIDVVEALKDVGGHLSFGPTKNHERRTVGDPRFLCEQLGERLAGGSDPEALVFTAPNRGPLRHNAFYKRVFKPAAAAAGLPPSLRWHDLRHTAAALLIAQGGHPRAIMERLGHSSVQVTLDVYGHLFPAIDEALTDGLERTYRAALAAGSWYSRGTDVVQALPGREAAAP